MIRTRADGPLSPGAIIGIVGGGQLGRMLSLAAARLGFDVAVLAREAGSPAGRVSAYEIVAEYGDPEALRRLGELCDVVTFEFENLSAPALAALAEDGVAVRPPAQALLVSQDRVLEKNFLNRHGVETCAFAEVAGPEDIKAALERLGAPALLKSRRDGYDGKGQAWVRSAAEAEAAFEAIGARPAVLEEKVAFVREVSVIGARGCDGALAFYPMGENRHESGVLRRTLAPAEAPAALRSTAEDMTRRLLEALDYVGVIGLELFELPGGRLIANEFAPRVHNTGHWTLDGCAVDQFEQHVRAVAGWPLGPVDPLFRTEMVNLLGDEAEAWEPLSKDPEARLWLYGKGASAPRRKMGHVNRRADRS